MLICMLTELDCAHLLNDPQHRVLVSILLCASDIVVYDFENEPQNNLLDARSTRCMAD